MKKLFVFLALVVCGVVPSIASANFYSNTFQSPTGNLVCKYRPIYSGTIACGAFNNQKVINMTAYGRPQQGNVIRWDPANTKFYTLSYGWKWNEGKAISCTSLYSGMRCANSAGWFFKIDRERIYVGRYGQLLYWM